MTGVLIGRGNVGTDRHTGGEHVHVKMVIYKSKREASAHPSLTALRRNQPTHTWILDFWPPELGDNIFLFFQPPRLWYFVMTTLAKEYKHFLSSLNKWVFMCHVQGFSNSCSSVHDMLLSVLFEKYFSFSFDYFLHHLASPVPCLFLPKLSLLLS